jgi:hypothetical protein
VAVAVDLNQLRRALRQRLEEEVYLGEMEITLLLELLTQVVAQVAQELMRKQLHKEVQV